MGRLREELNAPYRVGAVWHIKSPEPIWMRVKIGTLKAKRRLFFIRKE